MLTPVGSPCCCGLLRIRVRVLPMLCSDSPTRRAYPPDSTSTKESHDLTWRRRPAPPPLFHKRWRVLSATPDHYPPLSISCRGIEARRSPTADARRLNQEVQQSRRDNQTRLSGPADELR